MKKLVYILTAACAIAACTPKEIVPVVSSLPSSSSKVFYANVEGNDTKVINVGNKLYWADGDSIAVFDHNTGASVYGFTASDSDTYLQDEDLYISDAAAFTLKTEAAAGSALEHTYAVYPFNSSPVMNADGSIDVNIYDDQTPTMGEDKIDTEYANVIVAVSDNEHLDFKNVCGYLRIPLLGAGKELAYIEIVANGGESITGSATVTFDDSGLPETTVKQGSPSAYKEYAWSFGSYHNSGPILSETENFDVVFCLLPGVLQNGFTINATDADGIAFKASVSGRVEIKRNVMTSTAPLTAQFIEPVVDPAPLPYKEDFEAELLGWSYIDADGDGNKWSYSNSENNKAHSGTGVMTSASYAGSALTPDNWVFSAPIQLTNADAVISYWVSAQDMNYKSEHYAVYITDQKPKDNYSSATKLYEATFSAIAYENIQLAVPAEFLGKVVYIGFRHFDCTDMFRLNIDDLEVYEGTPAVPDPAAYEDFLGQWSMGINKIWTISEKVSGSSYSITGINGQDGYPAVEALYQDGKLVLNEATLEGDVNLSGVFPYSGSYYLAYPYNTQSPSALFYGDIDSSGNLVLSPGSCNYGTFAFFLFVEGDNQSASTNLPATLTPYDPNSAPDPLQYAYDIDDLTSGLTMDILTGTEWDVYGIPGDGSEWYTDYRDYLGKAKVTDIADDGSGDDLVTISGLSYVYGDMYGFDDSVIFDLYGSFLYSHPTTNGSFVFNETPLYVMTNYIDSSWSINNSNFIIAGGYVTDGIVAFASNAGSSDVFDGFMFNAYSDEAYTTLFANIWAVRSVILVDPALYPTPNAVKQKISSLSKTGAPAKIARETAAAQRIESKAPVFNAKLNAEPKYLLRK